MARANSQHTTNPSTRRGDTTRRRLSAMFTDPFLRDVFARAERDRDDDFGVIAEVDHPPHLGGGAAVHLTGLTGRRVLVEA